MCKRKPRKKKRDVWCKDWLWKGKPIPTLAYWELKIYPHVWHNYLRMNVETSLNLLSLLTPLIKKPGVIMREAATPLHHTRDYQQHCGFSRPEGVMKTWNIQLVPKCGHTYLICTTARMMRFFKMFIFSYIISSEGIYLLNNCFLVGVGIN
jgi:hypothetical protein